MWDKLKGPFLVALAAILWATDAPFRAPLTHRIDPTSIVLFDHLLGASLLFVFAIFRDRSALLKLSLIDWILAFLVGAGGSALALFFFTAAFEHLNPSVVILLQKLQPIFVTLVAYGVLRERPVRSFYGWAALALVSAVVLSLPYLQYQSTLKGFLSLSLQSKGVLYAVLAAALWGSSTVCGKILLKKHPPSIVTFWRYAFGALALIVMLSLSPTHHDNSLGVSWELFTPGVLHSLLYLSLVSGLLAMLIYYQGLSRTPATVATFVELIYPVSAVLLNTWLLRAPLSPVQAVAGTALIFSVLRLSSTSSA